MNYVFRTDSSSEIGYGHLMRCLVLAKELEQHDSTIHFICRDNSGSAHKLVEEAGYVLHLLPGKAIVSKSTHHKDWLGRTQAEDAEDCNCIIEYLPNSHMIVDHYGIDIKWESRISSNGLTVIDDLADRPHQCSRLIDQSLVHTKEDYKQLIEDDFEFWGGANILLRDEFRKTKNWEDCRSGSLLICMGGADPQNMTIKIVEVLLEWLCKTPEQQLVKKIDIVIGNAFDRKEELEICLVDPPIDVNLHRAPHDVALLMRNVDVAVLACGTMILEACALGIPAIGVTLAENQIATASLLEDRKAILLLDSENEFGKSLVLNIEKALTVRAVLSNLSKNAKILVDKNAAKNIARAIVYGY